MPSLCTYLTPSAHGTVLRRELGDCTGWDCLTQAEQFGIILSIVVTSVILILAYMYYLGKITEAHRELALVAHRRRHRSRTRRTHPPLSLPLTQPPVIQTLPNCPPGPMYQPVVCHVTGATLRQPQHFLVPGYYPQQPMPMNYSIPQYQPPNVHRPPSRFSASTPTRESSARDVSPASSSSRGLPPRQPTWRQRLARALGLQMGRASTISSSSGPRTPRRSRSRSRAASEDGDAQSEAERGTPAPTSNTDHTHTRGPSEGILDTHRDHRVDPTPATGDNPVPLGDTERAESLHTDVATVHSDDFEMVPVRVALHPQQPQNASAPETRVPAVRPDARDREIDDSPESDSCSDERYTVPSVSSLQTDFSPDLGPRTSVTPNPEDDPRWHGESAHNKPVPIGRTGISSIPRHELQPSLIRIALSNETLVNRRESRLVAFLGNSARTLRGRANESRNVNGSFWSNRHAKPRGPRLRDLRRIEWDMRRVAPSEVSDDDNSRPMPPEAIHQGGGIYSR